MPSTYSIVGPIVTMRVISTAATVSGASGSIRSRQPSQMLYGSSVTRPVYEPAPDLVVNTTGLAVVVAMVTPDRRGRRIPREEVSLKNEWGIFGRSTTTTGRRLSKCRCSATTRSANSSG